MTVSGAWTKGVEACDRRNGERRDMDTSQAGTPQGRQVVGRFGGVDTARRKQTDAQVEQGKPGSPVQGMYLVTIFETIGDHEKKHELTFFETDQDGDVTKISQTIDAGTTQPGDLVSVRFRSGTSKGKYVSDTAVAMTVIEKAN